MMQLRRQGANDPITRRINERGGDEILQEAMSRFWLLKSLVRILFQLFSLASDFLSSTGLV